MGLATSKFHQWRGRYGKVWEHNGKIPRDWWLEEWEKVAILDYHDRHPLEGYRRLCFMMLDDDVVAVSPSSVYRVLKSAGRLDRHRSRAVEERHGVCAARWPAQALACGHLLRESRGHLLLPDHRAGRLQPLHRPHGDPRAHEGVRHRGRGAACLGEVSGREGRGSSPTTARSSSRETSRSSSG